MAASAVRWVLPAVLMLVLAALLPPVSWAVASMSGSGAGSDVVATGSPVRSMAGTFVSLKPPCSCSSTAVIERYSLRTGAPLRAVATVTGPGSSTLQTDEHGELWVTTTTGPRYVSPVAGGDPQPNTCTGNLTRYDPLTGTSHTVLRFPTSELVGAAVPSPTGDEVALLAGGCNTSYFNQHVIVEDLRTGRTVQIGAGATPCHDLFHVAWSPDGSTLLFPYGPSVLPATTSFVPHGTCIAPRWGRLAIVSARHSSNPGGWRLIDPPAHCSYVAAAFDRAGILAAAACTIGDPPGFSGSPQLGDAFLVQLSPRGRSLLRLPLAHGFNNGNVVSNPLTGQVLISEEQAAHTGHRVYDRVWSFDRDRLHLVGRYEPSSPSVTALPW